MRRLTAVPLLLATLAPAPAPAAADDPFYVYGFQWGLTRIKAEAAWAVAKGEGAVVAVLDTGVDLDHPDLQGRLLEGADFVEDDNGRGAPDDENGHGTLIAGIVSATTFNGVGVASVAPSARILPVRVLDEDGTGSSEAVSKGIRWAVDEGADVVNLSLAQEEVDGGTGLLPSELLRDPSVDQAIRYAAEQGATVVIAAGNDHAGARDETSYDAVVPGAIVVGASTKGDQVASYSNYGRGLDLLAPGGGSAQDPSSDACTEDNSIVSTWWNPVKRRSDYGGGCGTSMAVAFVSGVAALLDERGLSNDQVVQRILTTADDLGPAGRDDRTGHGRLDSARAVGAPARTRTQPIVPPTGRAPVRGGSVRAEGSPVPTPRLTTQRALPPRRPPEPLPRDGLASPAAPEGPDGGPVGVATSLAVLVMVGHSWRVAARARARR